MDNNQNEEEANAEEDEMNEESEPESLSYYISNLKKKESEEEEEPESLSSFGSEELKIQSVKQKAEKKKVIEETIRFYKEEKKKNKGKNNNAIPKDIINILYEQPIKFFETIDSIISIIEKKKTIMDSCEMNLIIHYLTLLENNYNEPDNIYAKNFTLFFTKLKNFLNYKTRNGDTFLHIFTKNSKKSFVISTLTHLIKEEIITQELLSEKNNEDIIMISYIIEYIKKNYMSIINNELLYQSYIEFFDLLKEKFPTFCEKCIKKEEYLEIVRLENKITFDKDNLKDKEISEIVKDIKSLVSTAPILINSLLYLDNIQFNILNFIINKKDYKNALTIIQLLDTIIKKEENKIQYSSILLDNLKFICKKSKIINNDAISYIKTLLDIIKSFGLKIQSFFDNDSGKNIFHYLFENHNLTFSSVKHIYTLLDTFYNNDKEVIMGLLSSKDSNNLYPIISFLLNQSLFINKEKDYKEIEQFVKELYVLTDMREEESESENKKENNDNMEEKEKEEEKVINSEESKIKKEHLKKIDQDPRFKEEDKHPQLYLLNFLSPQYEMQFKILFTLLMGNDLYNFFEITNEQYFITVLGNSRITKEIFNYIFSFIQKYSLPYNEKIGVQNIFRFLYSNFNLCKDEDIHTIFTYFVKEYKEFQKINKINYLEEGRKKEESFLSECKNTFRADTFLPFDEYNDASIQEICSLIKSIYVPSNEGEADDFLFEFIEAFFLNLDNLTIQTKNEIIRHLIPMIPFHLIFNLIEDVTENKKAIELIIDNIDILFKQLKIIPIDDIVEEEKRKANVNWYILNAIGGISLLMHNEISYLNSLEFYLKFIAQIEGDIKYLFSTFIYCSISNSTLTLNHNNPHYYQNMTIINHALFESQENDLFDKIPILNKLLMYCTILDRDFSIDMFDNLLLKVDKKGSDEVFRILNELHDNSSGNKFTIDNTIGSEAITEVKSYYESLKDNLKLTMYESLFNYLKNTFSRSLYYVDIFVTETESMIIKKDEKELFYKKLLLNIGKYQIIVESKDYSIEQEIELFLNLFLNYKTTRELLCKGASKIEKKISKVIFFIKDENSYNTFFNQLIQHNTIRTFIFEENFKKENEDSLLAQYIKYKIKSNQRLKQYIISYFAPSYIIMNKPSYFLFSEHVFMLSFNPFSFLIYGKVEKYIESYKTLYSEMIKDKKVKQLETQNKSMYVHYGGSFEDECRAINSVGVLNQFINNLILFTNTVEQLNDYLKKNQSFNEALCCVLIFLFEGKDILYTNNCIDLQILIEFLFTKLDNLFAFYRNYYNKQLLVFFISYTLSYKKFANYVFYKEVKDNINLTIRDKIFSDKLLPFISGLDFIEFKNIIYKLCYIFLSLKDLSYFNTFFDNVVSNHNLNSFYVILHENDSSNFMNIICIAYSIYKNDVNAFRSILENVKISHKDYILEKILLDDLYGYKYISQRTNKFTKFLAKYFDSNFLNMTLLCSSENIFDFITESIISIKELHLIFQNEQDKSMKYGFRQAVFASKSINTILEFNDDFKFTSFESIDYELISQYYNNENDYDTYIKCFNSYFPNFNLVTLFIACIINDNQGIASKLFGSFNQNQKEKILSEDISQLTNQKENIIHYICSKNYFTVLKELLSIIKLKSNEYSHLITDYKEEMIVDCDIKKEIHKTPIYYAIINKSYECFALLYDLCSDKSIISSTFFMFSNCNTQGINSYLLYFKDENNKRRIKEYNNMLFLISESIVCISDALSYENKMSMESLFFFLLTNPNTFSSKDKLFSILSSTDNKNSFLAAYILISIFKIFPSEDILDVFLFNKEEMSKDKEESFEELLYQRKINENVLIYILLLLEKEGYRIISIEKYLPKNYGERYIINDINRIKSIKEYEYMIKNRNVNYTLHTKCQMMIEKQPLMPLVICGLLGMKKLGYILIRELNLVNRVKMLSKKGKNSVVNIFHSFDFQLSYYFENYDKITNWDIIDLFKPYHKNQQEEEKYDNEEDFFIQEKYDNEEDFFIQDGLLWNGYINENEFDCDLRSPFECNLNDEGLIKSSVFRLTFDFPSLLIHKEDFKDTFNYDNLKIQNKDCIKIYDNLLTILVTLQSALNEIITLNHDSFTFIYFGINQYDNIFNELTKKINIEKFINFEYEQYISIYKNKLILPTYLKDYYIYSQDYLLKRINQIDKIKGEYLKYYTKLHTYIDYFIQFIDELYSFDAEEMISSLLSNEKEQNSDLIIKVYKNIKFSFVLNEDVTLSKEILKESYHKIMNVLYQCLLEETIKSEVIIIPFMYNKTEQTICETTSKTEIKQWLKTKVSYIFNSVYSITIDKYSYLMKANLNVFFPSFCNSAKDKYNTDFLKFSKELYNKKNEYLDIKYFLHYVYLNLRRKTFNYDELITSKEDNYFKMLLLVFLNISSDMIKSLPNNVFINRALKDYICNLENYGFISYENLFMKSIETETPINDISLMYTNEKHMIAYLTKIIGASILHNEQLNKLSFAELCTINLNYFPLCDLVNKYISEDILFKLNPQFTQAQIEERTENEDSENNKKNIMSKEEIEKIKNEVYSLFKSKILYQLFNKDNSFILAIEEIITRINIDINKTNVKFLVDFNKEFKAGLTIEFDDVNTLDKLIEIENIDFNAEKKDNTIIITMLLSLSFCQLRYIEHVNKFKEALMKEEKKIKEISREYSKWFNGELYNKNIEKLKVLLQ